MKTNPLWRTIQFPANLYVSKLASQTFSTLLVYRVSSLERFSTPYPKFASDFNHDVFFVGQAEGDIVRNVSGVVVLMVNKLLLYYKNNRTKITQD